MIASSLRSMATRERATHMPASERVSARAKRVAFWRKWGGFGAFFGCRVGETVGRDVWQRARDGIRASQSANARAAYIAVRNEATRESLLSERVAARTRK